MGCVRHLLSDALHLARLSCRCSQQNINHNLATQQRPAENSSTSSQNNRIIKNKKNERSYKLICWQSFALRCSFERYLSPSLIFNTFVSIQCLVLLCTQCLNLTRLSHGFSCPSAKANTKAWLHGQIVDTEQFDLDLLLDFCTWLSVRKTTTKTFDIVSLNDYLIAFLLYIVFQSS